MMFYPDVLRKEEAKLESKSSRENLRMQILGYNNMPKDMFPSQEVFESLGFRFWELPNNFKFNGSMLPDGWYEVDYAAKEMVALFDAENFLAGYIFYAGDVCRLELTKDYIEINNLNPAASKVKKRGSLKTLLLKEYNNIMHPRTKDMER